MTHISDLPFPIKITLPTFLVGFALTFLMTSVIGSMVVIHIFERIECLDNAVTANETRACEMMKWHDLS